VQGFPNPRGNTEIAREIKRLTKDRPTMVVSQQTIQGFAAAKLVTEALKRAGKKPTPQLLVTALESIRDFDMGGFLITYGPADHTGAEFVEMSIIDKRGEFLQ
jgi:ABC-type branched-subunit amino acid transport system substrate-binding protein